MTDIWKNEPEIPNSRDKKYSRMGVDWWISSEPVDHFKSVEYMRDLRKWKKKHDAWLEKIKTETDRAMQWLAYIDALKLTGGIAEIKGWKEKAEKYEAAEFIIKENVDGKLLDIYGLNELTTAVDDKRIAEKKLGDIETALKQGGFRIKKIKEILEGEG